MLEFSENIEQNENTSTDFDEELHRNFLPEEANPAQTFEKGAQDNPQQSFKGDWIETGFQDVPVAAIDDSQTYVQSPDDFHKVAYEDMTQGFEILEKEVRPAVEQGANGDYFRDLDTKRGLDYPHGSQRVYDAFYGDGAIRLTKIGNTYDVTNGYHRIYTAKQLGIPTVPAQVVEQR